MVLAFTQFQIVKSKPFFVGYGRLFVAAAVLLVSATHALALTASGPIVISGQNGTVISGLSISSTSGPCVQIINSTNITIKDSNIGPCGTSNTTTNSWGVYVGGGSGINIYDNYIHVENMASSCADSHDGIYISNSASTVAIQGNVIAYNERNIRVWGGSNISVTGNFILNPRGAASCSDPDNLGGDQFQAWESDATPNQNITVINNYTLNSTDTTTYKFAGNVSDSINFGVTNGILVENNYVVGGGYKSGCGIVADYKANSAQILNNIVSNAYGCGIGVASGTNQTVSGNKVLILQPSSGSAAGVSINGGYSPVPCGPVSVSSNISYAINSGNWVQGYWNDGYCPTVATGNTFDVGCTAGVNCTAYNILKPMSSTNLPPLIPPQPHSCVAPSPYSTQTNSPACTS
jgi:hypothetical protein